MYCETASPNQPPNCSGAYALPASLWPPDHKMMPVAVQGVSDPDGDAVQISVVSVWQDEPVRGLGDGDTSPDAKLAGGSAQIRRERSGIGDGRVYHLGFVAVDSRGGSCTGEVQVCVPHDKQPDAACVDQGSLFDSTQR